MVPAGAERHRAKVALTSDIIRVTRSLGAEQAESAYRAGAFPMAHVQSGVVTWHRPKRRAILPLERFHASQSLRRVLRQRQYQVTFDRAFAAVMEACARPGDTWISQEFQSVYGELHARGKAHSVEVWVEGALAGGLYGVHLGGAFFAESKFHRRANMSKVALAELVFRLRERGFALLEVQYLTPHLAQFGVVEIPGREYLARLKSALALRCEFL